MFSDVNVVFLKDFPSKVEVELVSLLPGLTYLLAFKVKLWLQQVIELVRSFVLEMQLNKEVTLHHVRNLSPALFEYFLL